MVVQPRPLISAHKPAPDRRAPAGATVPQALAVQDDQPAFIGICRSADIGHHPLIAGGYTMALLPRRSREELALSAAMPAQPVSDYRPFAANRSDVPPTAMTCGLVHIHSAASGPLA